MVGRTGFLGRTRRNVQPVGRRSMCAFRQIGCVDANRNSGTSASDKAHDNRGHVDEHAFGGHDPRRCHRTSACAIAHLRSQGRASRFPTHAMTRRSGPSRVSHATAPAPIPTAGERRVQSAAEEQQPADSDCQRSMAGMKDTLDQPYARSAPWARIAVVHNGTDAPRSLPTCCMMIRRLWPRRSHALLRPDDQRRLVEHPVRGV